METVTWNYSTVFDLYLIILIICRQSATFTVLPSHRGLWEPFLSGFLSSFLPCPLFSLPFPFFLSTSLTFFIIIFKALVLSLKWVLVTRHLQRCCRPLEKQASAT